MRDYTPRRLLALLLCVIYVAVSVAFSPEPIDTTPRNDAYKPRVTWEGYGVDWMLRSLRIGTTFKDSLMADGWLGLYGIDVDTLNAGTMSVDTLIVPAWLSTGYLAADSGYISSWLVADSLGSTYGGIDTLISLYHSTSLIFSDSISNSTYIQSDSLRLRSGGFLNLIGDVDSSYIYVGTVSTSHFSSGAEMMADSVDFRVGVFSEFLEGPTADVDTLIVGYLRASQGLSDTLVTAGNDSIFVQFGLITGFVPGP